MSKIFFPLLLSFITIKLSIESTTYTLDLEELRSSLLAEHNSLRKSHQVNSLTRDSDIEKIAQQYAEQCVELESTSSSDNTYNGEALGENIYRGNYLTIYGDEISSIWYSEISNYNFSKPGFYSNAGHFTQIVWKSTTKIGCGAACNDTATFCVVVCNYYPKGNTKDEDFAENVLVESDQSDESNENGEGSNVLMIVIIVVVVVLVLAVVGFLVLHFVNKKKKDEVQEYMNN